MQTTTTTASYEETKAAFLEAEKTWDAAIKRQYRKPWFLLSDSKQMEGEPGTAVNDAYVAFQAALEAWKAVANDPADWWKEAKGVA